MTPPGAEPRFSLSESPALAARFAGHLRTLRNSAGLPTGLVTARRPAQADLAGGSLIRVGHFVATTNDVGLVADTVLWELLPAAAYRAWLADAPVPDRAALERAVPGLLRLRALHRGHQLPALGLVDLAELLEGRYLSARIAHRYPTLVLAAAARAIARNPSPPVRFLTEPC